MTTQRDPIVSAYMASQSPDEIELARRWSDRCLRAVEKKGPNYTKLHRNDRFFIGYRGELAVLAWLRSEGFHPDHHVRTNGRSQRSEITLDMSRRKLQIEVKTAGQPYYRKMMMPLRQKTRFDVIVGARIWNESQVEVIGWLWRHQIDNVMTIEDVHIATRSCVWGRLRPLASLVTELKQRVKKYPA